VWPESGASTNNNALGIIIFFTTSQLSYYYNQPILNQPFDLFLTYIISRPAFSDTMAPRKRVASRKVQENQSSNQLVAPTPPRPVVVATTPRPVYEYPLLLGEEDNKPFRPFKT